MRKIYLTFMLLAIVAIAHAQSIAVESFRLLEGDMTTTSLEGKRMDQNNEVAALIKIVTTQTGFSFEAGALGVVDSQQRNGEIWVWVPRASRKITILNQKFGVLRDYRYPVEIKADRTYEMVLVTKAAPEPNADSKQVSQQYLIFQVTPADAALEVDDQLWPVTNGTARKFVDFGTYTYRVQAPNYHPDGGRVTVDDPVNKKIVKVDLKPNFGWVEVKGSTAQGADVYIDNAYIGKAPCKSGILKSGTHTVKIAKEMYEPYTEEVMVNDEQTCAVEPKLTADFARLTLTVDADAEIWVDEEKKGIRTWTGNLGTGTHSIECRMANHEPSSTNKVVNRNMDGQTITLSAPTPIYGSLNVESTPDFAKIYIDGKPMGETPNFIPEILIGQHEIRLTKDGYADYIQTVTIAKGERKQVKATMNKQEGQPLLANNTNSGEDQTFTVNNVSFTMKLVEGGTFQMGATSEQGDDAYDSEKPAHNVTLSSYYMGETEVTQALWNAVMGDNPSYFKGDNLPVEKVSWNDCQEFIRKLNQKTGKNFRLPTEAEWEYAARGGKKSNGYKYSGYNNIGSVAWYTDNSSKQTHAVKGKRPNELGLYDMSGNVWEWCQDWYGSYGSSSQNNPMGPSSGSYRVLRGGSWINFAGICRVSFRYLDDPDYGNSYYGFRLCLPQ